MDILIIRLLTVRKASLSKRQLTRCLTYLSRHGESRYLVDAVIDGIVYPFILLFDLLFESRRQKTTVWLVRLSQLLRYQSIELGIKHADDLRALVADNSFFLLVPEHRYGISNIVNI
jgi:hypothetical protein